ncbi:TlpA family protein disulfide reductase [Sphingomonas sp. KRR8]|uniref:TlpA disulfide reductase family protein n=1 Tax=Sphingomonas sp. KRR8 TaxID=2942996 RepID=UPI00202063B9|nr:TlpA disulfide reductase family protein [Sphingomonas sp. KRR8]URD61117.1 TlpA family protein disulfide reductase [Sphingomonas sp. KRR8]
MTLPQTFQLGPLILSSDRVLALVLFAFFLAITSVVAKRVDVRAERAGWWALVIGVATARAGYVLMNWDAFAADPLSIMLIWQGGFSLAAGLAGALAAITVTMRRLRSAIILASSIAVLGAAFLGVSAALHPAPISFPASIALRTRSGEPVVLSELRGRPFVINLWASWCLPCRREMPMLAAKASHSPVAILLVNSGEPRDVAAGFLERSRLPSQSVLLDPGAALAAAIGVSGYPATLFVNSAGKIETMHFGEISRAMLEAELRDLERQTR